MNKFRDITFTVLCDNYVEFERFFDITCSALNLKKSNFEISSDIPTTLIDKDLNIEFQVFIGFGRSGDNYWNSNLNKSLYIKENPDVLVSIDTNSITKLFAIEFCSALPAGNQSWQRFARGKELSKNGTDYFFVSQLGGKELADNRKELSVRYPNPIVNYGAFRENQKSKTGLYLNILTKKPGCSKNLLLDFKNYLGSDLLEKYILNVASNNNQINFVNHQMGIIKTFISKKKKLSDFEKYLVNNKTSNHARKNVSGWKKKYSIEVSSMTEKILIEAKKCSNDYYGVDIPFVLIRNNKVSNFLKKINKFLNTKLKIQCQNKKKVFFCAIAGFKPKGDDARPDRGIVPLVDSIADKNDMIITLVFGPASEMTEDKLKNDPVSLCRKNGLWGSVFQYSDYVIVTSLKFKNHLVLKGHRGKGAVFKDGFKFFDKEIKFIPTENDVDTAIHISLKYFCQLFESLFNPPGGDWSGVSFYNKKNEEIRYLSLPRAPDSSNNKRPDHIYNDYKNNIIFLIESKITYSSIFKEQNVGKKMKNWTNNLIKYPPNVKRKKNKDWESDTGPDDKILNPKFITCGAFMEGKETVDEYKRLLEHCALDIIFLIKIKDNSWSIRFLLSNSNISTPECLTNLSRQDV
jgi:hypothetical protein